MAETKRTLLERIDQQQAQHASQLSGMLTILMQMSHEMSLAFSTLLQLGQTTLNGVTMANAALEAIITQINDATNLVAARIDALTTALAGVATPEQLAELGAIRDHLSALGADPTNPVPTPDPVPVPDPTPAPTT